MDQVRTIFFFIERYYDHVMQTSCDRDAVNPVRRNLVHGPDAIQQLGPPQTAGLT
jgi:hypothetical protein